MKSENYPQCDLANRVLPHLGMFATEDIQAGTCIVDERPFILACQAQKLVPTPGLTDDEVRKVLFDNWNEAIKAAWNRMDEGRKYCFLTLKNAHTEGDDYSKPFLGRFRTNSMGCGIKFDGISYGGVCNCLSRVNHRYVFTSPPLL
jgi:hypothetical protein